MQRALERVFSLSLASFSFPFFWVSFHSLLFWSISCSPRPSQRVPAEAPLPVALFAPPAPGRPPPAPSSAARGAHGLPRPRPRPAVSCCGRSTPPPSRPTADPRTTPHRHFGFALSPGAGGGVSPGVPGPNTPSGMAAVSHIRAQEHLLPAAGLAMLIKRSSSRRVSNSHTHIFSRREPSLGSNALGRPTWLHFYSETPPGGPRAWGGVLAQISRKFLHK